MEDIFGEAWDIYNWELGREILPTSSCPPSELLLDDFELFNRGENRRSKLTMEPPNPLKTTSESEFHTSSASVQTLTALKTEAGTEVASNANNMQQNLFERPDQRKDMSVTEYKRELSNALATPAIASSVVLTSPLLATDTGTPRGLGQRPKKPKPNATSQFKGVTKHRVTGKYEAHLWDASVIRKGKNRRGRNRGKQIYLGSFSSEIAAARTFDMAAICYWGETAYTNFPISDYAADLSLLKTTEKDTIVKILRRTEGGYQSGSDRFVGLAMFRPALYEDPSSSFDTMPY